MKKKLTAVLLTVSSILSIGVPVYAQGKEYLATEAIVITPYYQYVSSVGATLSINNSGKAVSTGYVYYIGNYDSTVTIELQKQNGSGWSTVKSWSQNFSGAGTHPIEKEYYVASGNVYRVLATASVKNGNTILETVTSTSSQVSY